MVFKKWYIAAHVVQNIKIMFTLAGSCPYIGHNHGQMRISFFTEMMA